MPSFSGKNIPLKSLASVSALFLALTTAYQNCGNTGSARSLNELQGSLSQPEGGGPDGSQVSGPPPQPQTPGPTPGESLNASSSQWKNTSFETQSGPFLAEFDLVPLANNMDAVTALSAGPLGSYAESPMMIRFNPSGQIDVRNGSAYEALTPVDYFATNTYHVRLIANTSSKTYSVYVTPNNGTELELAKDFAFRTEAASASSIDNLGIVAPIGSHKILNFKVTPIALAQPTPGPINGTVSFFADWGANSSTGGWRSRQTVSADRIRVDGTKTVHGFTAARVQVSPGDDPINASGERSEVLQMPIAEDNGSGTQYYALSYKFPSTWQSTASSNPAVDWSIIFQLHGPDSLGTSPVFALNALQNGYSVTLYGGEIGNGAREVEYPISGGMPKDKWTDLVIMIDYKADKTGHVSIWRRDEGEAAFTLAFDKANVATLQYRGSVGAHYWKQGLYRGQNKGLTNVLWIGPTARATTFEAAEAKAFGTRSGRP